MLNCHYLDCIRHALGYALYNLRRPVKPDGAQLASILDQGRQTPNMDIHVDAANSGPLIVSIVINRPISSRSSRHESFYSALFSYFLNCVSSCHAIPP